MLQTYVQEVLRKNDYPATSWPWREDSLITLRTERNCAARRKINNAAYDSLAPAWRYFTGIFSGQYRLHHGMVPCEGDPGTEASPRNRCREPHGRAHSPRSAERPDKDG